ncbi:hypothetical protein NC651_004266, partial [Populus alba x Populus x berolinensis]
RFFSLKLSPDQLLILDHFPIEDDRLRERGDWLWWGLKLCFGIASGSSAYRFIQQTSRGKNLPLYHVKKRIRSKLLNMKREQELKLYKLAA